MNLSDRINENAGYLLACAFIAIAGFSAVLVFSGMIQGVME